MMDKQKTLAMIEALSNAPGVSGFEDEAVQALRRYSEGLGTIREDALRNLYVTPEAQSAHLPLVQLDAHSDEVGYLVKALRPNGTLDFITLGRMGASNIPAHRVLVRNTLGQYIPGIIAGKPPHFMTEAEKHRVPDICDMVIDVGASSDRELRDEYHIGIAAPVVPDTAFVYRPDHDVMIGKAFDNRLGCAGIIAVLGELAGQDLKVRIAGAFAAQEEVGLRGATITAQELKPDIAIVFEGSPADDTIVESYAVQTALKKGPMLRHFDVRMITNPRFQRFALDLARSKRIPVQEAVRTGGSTNAGVIHLTGKAVPVIVIGIPVRYIHTHYGIAAYRDFDQAVTLACEVIRHLDEAVINGF